MNNLFIINININKCKKKKTKGKNDMLNMLKDI